MRQIGLIAWREYKQYVLSRGFLLFLVFFPLALVAAGAALNILEGGKPVRTFIVYDETGKYTDDIDREIEARQLLSAILAWDAYFAANVTADDDARSQIPEPFLPGFTHDRRAKSFIQAGGFEAAKAAIAPYLRPGAAGFVMPRAAFKRLPTPDDVAAAGNLSDVENRLRPYLMGERLVQVEGEEPAPLFAGILIPEGFGGDEDADAAQYWSRNLTDNSLEIMANSALNSALQRELIIGLGLPDDALDDVSSVHAPINAYRPDKAPEDAQLDIQDRIETALPAMLTYMLLVIIFGVGNLLLTNTIEERSNKIVEILLSSVTAEQLMMGKLLGIAAVGLTMPSIFLFGGLAVSATALTADNVVDVAIASLFSSPLLLIYLFYFLCAYGIFAMIFLAIGAVSNSLQDAQSYMGPVMLLVFAPLPFMLMVFQNPNGMVASVLTWIPVYTPYAVMMRAAADPPIWEIVGATALMLAFAIFLARIMGRVFRQAILQASPPRMRDVWRLARSEQG